MSSNGDYDEVNASFHKVVGEKSSSLVYLDDVKKTITEKYSHDELTRTKSLSIGVHERKGSLYRSRMFCNRNSEDVRRLILPISMVHRNYKEFTDDLNLLMHASDNSFSFYYNEDICDQQNDLFLNDEKLHSVFDYSSLQRIAFYKSHHGAFNKNPNESIGEDIMHLSTNNQEFQGSESTTPSKNKLNSCSSSIAKIINFIFKRNSSETNCNLISDGTSMNDSSKCETNFFESDEDELVNSSNDSDENQEKCYMTIDYKTGSHVRRCESVHFKTKLSHMRKIYKFIGSRFPGHRRVKSSSLVAELPELEQSAIILSKELLADLMHFVPLTFHSTKLNVVYSTYYHGHSLKTLYRCCENLSEGFFILVIRETSGSIFGALLSHAPQVFKTRYYGDPTCVVFRSGPEKGTIVYRWSGVVDYFIHCDPEFMIIGGCHGSGVAIFLDDNLFNGRSTKSDTFMSDKLSDSEDFVITGLELWIFGENIAPDSSRSVTFYPV